ncbi:9860_t:CDS:1, partial [Gigaspora rosea]
DATNRNKYQQKRNIQKTLLIETTSPSKKQQRRENTTPISDDTGETKTPIIRRRYGRKHQ